MVKTFSLSASRRPRSQAQPAWRPDGERTIEADRIELAVLDVLTLEGEGDAAGFEVEPAREIAPTDDHVGSTVVMLRG